MFVKLAATRMFATIDRGHRVLFPRSLDKALPDDHMARSFVKLVEELDLSELEAQYDAGKGRVGDAPSVLLSLHAGRN